MKLEVVKFLSALGLLLVTFLMTMLPVLLFRRRHVQEESFRMGLLSCFAGGVFLGTCLLHLFPEVQEQIECASKGLGIVPNYPISEFLVGFGFLLILAVEQILMYCHGGHQHIPAPNSSVNDQEAANTHQEPTNGDQSSLLPPNPPPSYGSIQEQTTSNPNVIRPSSFLRPLLLVIALSLHSVFEGRAIGLQTKMHSELRILMAVAIHKCVLAFSLGLSLNSSDLNKASVIQGNLAFSLTSPIGILLGVVVLDFVHGVAMLVTSGILQGIAAGTFLYVTLFEVLLKELGGGEDRMRKTSCVVLGYAIVALLLTVLPE